ncbi:MAG: hypothetical protein R3F60_14315 [bacterium]
MKVEVLVAGAVLSACTDGGPRPPLYLDPILLPTAACPLEVGDDYLGIDMYLAARGPHPAVDADDLGFWGLDGDRGTLTLQANEGEPKTVEVGVTWLGPGRPAVVGAVAYVHMGDSPTRRLPSNGPDFPPERSFLPRHSTWLDESPPSGASPVQAALAWLALQPKPRFLVVYLPDSGDRRPAGALSESEEATIAPALARDEVRLVVFEDVWRGEASASWLRLACGSGGARHRWDYPAFLDQAWRTRLVFSSPAVAKSGRLRGYFRVDGDDFGYSIDVDFPLSRREQ